MTAAVRGQRRGCAGVRSRPLRALTAAVSAEGVARLVGRGAQTRLVVRVRGLPAIDGAYQVWLYNSVSDAVAARVVRGRFALEAALPVAFADYRLVDISRSRWAATEPQRPEPPARLDRAPAPLKPLTRGPAAPPTSALVLATIATQASIVVLTPLVVEIGRDRRLARGGGPGPLGARGRRGGGLARDRPADRPSRREPLIVGGAVLEAPPEPGRPRPRASLPAFYVAHAVTGAGVACLFAGFAGVSAYFPARDAAWAMGWVGLAIGRLDRGQSLIGVLAEAGSWRLAYAVPATMAAMALVAGLRAPAGDTPAVDGGLRALAALREPSARRWTLAELVAYSAWTAELPTPARSTSRATASASPRSACAARGRIARLSRRIDQQRSARGSVPAQALIALAALAMGALLVPLLNFTPSVWFTVALFCVTAFFAAVRSTCSSALGLAQLPQRPGSMMGARTAGAQLGYAIGAAAGGAVLALSDFGALGFALFGGMLCSALLVLRVTDPLAHGRLGYSEPVPE